MPQAPPKGQHHLLGVQGWGGHCSGALWGLLVGGAPVTAPGQKLLEQGEEGRVALEGEDVVAKGPKEQDKTEPSAPQVAPGERVLTQCTPKPPATAVRAGSRAGTPCSTAMPTPTRYLRCFQPGLTRSHPVGWHALWSRPQSRAKDAPFLLHCSMVWKASHRPDTTQVSASTQSLERNGRGAVAYRHCVEASGWPHPRTAQLQVHRIRNVTLPMTGPPAGAAGPRRAGPSWSPRLPPCMAAGF